MAKYKLTAQLNEQSLTQLENELRNYRENILSAKLQKLVELLVEEGIMTARAHIGMSGKYGTHKMENRVTFYKKIDNKGKSQYIGYVIGQGEPFMVTWYPDGGNMPRTDMILPLHMIEYGTAAFAVRDYADSLGGKGSMAVQGNEDKTDWYFYDANGDKRLGTAITPTMPMFNASTQIRATVNATIKEVFG